MATIDQKDPHVIGWLSQMPINDQTVAQQLLENVLIVGADDLAKGLRKAIRTAVGDHIGPVALFSERHIRRYKGRPNKLFKETLRSPKRAFGDGPAPVPSGRPYARETGSEGVIATLITGLVRADPEKYLDHPGPELIRKRRVRLYIVVTDFIGSGRRSCDNLEAAWQIRSFKSWHSLSLLGFAVVAYSGTVAGVEKVEQHRSLPRVVIHQGCPIVDHIDPAIREKIVDLCERYAPRRLPLDRTALGYGNSGALIAFDHGIPNNAPLLLHTPRKNWVPLFRQRSMSSLSSFRETTRRQHEIDRALLNLRQARLASAPRFVGIADHEQEMMLLLVALRRRPRWSLAVSARTGLPILEVEALIEKAKADGYIDDALRLTEMAFKAISYLKTFRTLPKPLPKNTAQLYCPSQLRPPR